MRDNAPLATSAALPAAQVGRNGILATLPRDDLERISRASAIVSLEAGQSIFEPFAAVTDVYFPLTGVVSLLTVVPNGRSIEMAAVGREGLVGLAAFLGTGTAAQRAVVQVPGFAARVAVEAFRAETARSRALVNAILRYTQTLLHHVAQSAACNTLHSIERRCARWLLLCHDRVGGDTFPLTQEYLAQMLGARRPSVNIVAATFQERGLMRYSRGRVTIVDRAGLERVSCGCYRVIRDEYDRLFVAAGARRPG